MKKFGPFRTTIEFHDLGVYDPKLKGILSPLYDDVFVKKYIHEQFLNGSSRYIIKFQNLDYWKYLLISSQKYYSFNNEKEIKILDIGSGGGNTIFPLMDLYPNAYIVASDLSIPLLQSLKKYYEQNYKDHFCFIVQLNAEDIAFETNSIDLVVGGAILHHLFDPKKTLEQCYRVLKPGGAAIFFEPFEIGNQLVTLILKQLLELNGYKDQQLDNDTAFFFKGLVHDFKIRKGTSKTGELFLRMDDKWLFTREYIENTAKSIGFQEVVVYPLHGTHKMFSDQITTFLRQGVNKNLDALPRWAKDCISDADEHFSQELRPELLIAGGLIFKKISGTAGRNTGS